MKWVDLLRKCNVSLRIKERKKSSVLRFQICMCATEANAQIPLLLEISNRLNNLSCFIFILFFFSALALSPFTIQLEPSLDIRPRAPALGSVIYLFILFIQLLWDFQPLPERGREGSESLVRRCVPSCLPPIASACFRSVGWKQCRLRDVPTRTGRTRPHGCRFDLTGPRRCIWLDNQPGTNLLYETNIHIFLFKVSVLLSSLCILLK